MKKLLIGLGVLVCSLLIVDNRNSIAGVNADTLDLLDSTVFEGKKANVRYVAKGGFGAYSTISGALNSITDASATKPYILKVMPGIYNGAIQMKQYVDVVGSGQDSTKITSNASATVTGANNSTLANIWVDNSNTGSYGPAAILNSNASMTVDSVKVTINAPSNETAGIRSEGSSAQTTISNCNVWVGNDGEALGIVAKDGSLVTVSNCKVIVQATPSMSAWNAGIVAWGAGSKISIRDSEVTSEGARYNYAMDIEGSGGEIVARNVRLKAIAVSDTYQNIGIRDGGRSVTIANSEILLIGSGIMTTCTVYVSGTTKIGGSLMTPLNSNCGVPKIVHSWDESFNPIPNQ